jgi:two-component system chemotaxis response regulator CheY
MHPETAHLLIVDDSESMRRAISDVLLELGFRHLDEAADGLEALARFRARSYDVVITDWNMPRMNGLELLRAIRHEPARADTPVLILSGEVTSGRVVQALEAGANGFVAKPFISPALSSKLVQLVSSLPAPRDVAPPLSQPVRP